MMNSHDAKLLHEMIDSDIIKLDVSELLFDMKKEKVQKVHPYKITPPKSKTSRWQSYYLNELEEKVKVSSMTEQGIYEKLYYHYFLYQPVTLQTMYETWMKKRKTYNLSPRTLTRNEQHWKRYYNNNKIVEIPLERLTAENIEDFLHSVIRKFDITSKELGNMKGILKGCLKLAKKQGIIKEDPFPYVEINRYSCKPITKHSDSSRIYLPDEIEALFEALKAEIEQQPDNTDCYAIKLLFKLALRIGELVALKWQDIDWKNGEIHIHRMESRDELDQPCIEEHTKRKSPYGDRFLPLGEYEMELLRKVRTINENQGYKEEDFIFLDENGRTTIREIDNRIRKLCNKAKFEVKSAHDIRRTVASQLYNNGVKITDIRDFLGHSDVRTTWGYIYSLEEKEETKNQIISSLKNFNIS